MPEEKFYDAITTEVKTVPDEERVLRFVGTTEVRDRMGDEVMLKGWDFENYKKNPVFLWSHNYSELPIGRTISVQRSSAGGVKGFSFDVEFVSEKDNPKAEQIFQLYKKGFLSAVSVGFRPLASGWIEESEEDRKKREKDEPDARPGRRFYKKELLELSGTPVPANPEALIHARKKGLEIPPEVQLALDRYSYEKSLEAIENTRRIKEGMPDSSNDPEDWEVSMSTIDGEDVAKAIEEEKDAVCETVEETSGEDKEVFSESDSESEKPEEKQQDAVIINLTQECEKERKEFLDRLEAVLSAYQTPSDSSGDVSLPDDLPADTTPSEDVALRSSVLAERTPEATGDGNIRKVRKYRIRFKKQ